MTRLLTGRVVKTPNDQVPADRYQFLGLTDAEPNLGNPTGSGSVLASTVGGVRYWVDQVTGPTGAIGSTGATGRKYGMEKGAASPIGLFKLLYEYSNAGSVLVLDDCDSVLWDEQSLNLLKAALDSSPKRYLSWRSESRVLKNEGIPETFEFKGSIVFITNLKFDKTRGKIKDHLDAIMSRCHYLDLTLDTMRDKFLRCRQIVQDGMLYSYNFNQADQDELLGYIFDNRNKLREMSLRMVLKIADLKRMNGDKWKRYVEMTCMKRS